MILFAPIKWWAFKDAVHGAQTTLHCSLVDFNLLKGGEFYKDLNVNSPFRSARNLETQENLWEVSLQITNNNP